MLNSWQYRRGYIETVRNAEGICSVFNRRSIGNTRNMSIPSLLPYNHKNNLLINSETLHTKSQQRLSKDLILLSWKMIGVNDVSLVNCYFTASLKVKTFLGSISFGEVKMIYVFHGIPLVEKEIDFELKNWRLHPCSRATPPRKLFSWFPSSDIFYPQHCK